MSARKSVDETTALISTTLPEIDVLHTNESVRAGSKSSSLAPGLLENNRLPTEENEYDSALIWTVIPIVLIGVFLANVDTSLVIASSQSVASDFNALSSASWLITSYALGQCAVQPLYGKLSSIFGRKNNLAFCYLVFGIGCLFSAVAGDYWHVLAGRVIAGVGGAGMTALVSILIADLVPTRQIASWRSFVNIAATSGRSIGAPLGGLLNDTVGWRWSFLGQVPVAIFGLGLLLWKLPSDTSRSESPNQSLSTADKFRRIDFLGAVTLAATISLTLLTLDLASKSSSWYVIASTLVGAIVLGSLFCVIELHHAAEPVLPIHLITQRTAWTSYLLVGVQVAAQSGIFYSSTIYFQIAAGMSVSRASLRLIPAVLGNASGSIFAGYMVSKTARYKVLSVVASLIAVLGYVLILIRWRGSTSWFETLYIMLGGFGMGIIQSTTFVHLAAYLNQEDLSIAGTTWYLAHNTCAPGGIQVSTTILESLLLKTLDRRLDGIENKQQIVHGAITSIGRIKSLPGAIRHVVEQVYVDCLRWTYLASVVFAVIGIPLGLSIQEGKIQ